MRILSLEEQDLCQRILNGSGNNNFLSNIIYHRLGGISIAIRRNPEQVKLFYSIQNTLPTENEQQGAIDKINEIQVLILTTVNLIKLLKKEGYIMLIRRTTNVENLSQFGQAIVNMPKIESDFADDKISKLLIKYIDKEIYVTEEFKVFCANDYLARDEQRYRNQLKRTTGILLVAFFALLLNTAVFVYSIFNPANPTEKIESSSENKIIKLLEYIHTDVHKEN